MKTPFVQVDVFTDKPFAGNPAAVFVLDGPRSEEWMQMVAREMNLSESAFLHPAGDGYDIRYFTPKVEVPLCGHASVASAHVLFTDGIVERAGPIRFRAPGGKLVATFAGDAVEMSFPAHYEKEVAPPDGLSGALGVSNPPTYTGLHEDMLVVLFENEETVRTLQPDISAMLLMPFSRFSVTAPSSDPAFDFVSRWFGPAIGINEDPVTGFAHTLLGPFWQKRLGKNNLIGYQASERGGTVRVRVEGDRVFLGGKAITVMRGEMIF